jgi:hypothetical protein
MSFILIILVIIIVILTGLPLDIEVENFVGLKRQKITEDYNIKPGPASYDSFKEGVRDKRRLR